MNFRPRMPDEKLRKLYRYLYLSKADDISLFEILCDILLCACYPSPVQQAKKSTFNLDQLPDNERYESDKALEEYLATLAPPAPTPAPPANTPKPANSPIEVAKAWFTAKKGTGRYRGYFETRSGTPIQHLKNKLSIDENGKYSLMDILFMNGKDSVNLCGHGGSGKTYQIFHCIEDILSGTTTDDEQTIISIPDAAKDTIPIYLPLNSLENVISGNIIVAYLARYVWHNEPETVEDVLSKCAGNMLIFADGLNEVTDSKMRMKIASDICFLRQQYGTRFLVSSRIDHTSSFNSLNYGSDQVFSKAKVLPLSRDQIDTYFHDVGCSARYKDVPFSTRKLLETPQGCVMFADYVGNNLSKIKNITSLGQLIFDYIDTLLNITSAHEKLLVYGLLERIARFMLLHNTFKISYNEMESLLSSSELDTLFKAENNVESIFSLSSNDCGEDSFEFSHQNFRDNYCAQYFAKQLKNIDADNIVRILDDGETFVNNSITTNDEILELVSCFISGGKIQEIIDILRNNKERIVGIYKDNYDFPLSVLVRIFAFSHHNCIAELNLSYLDLTEISLSGYELFDREGTNVINLAGSKISANTFLKDGLQTASSTICKYQLGGKTFIAAFAATTAMIIDVAENQVEIIRGMLDCDWIIDAVPHMYNGRLAIFLGCRNGCVAIFYPYKELNYQKEVFIATIDPKKAGKGKGEIETVIFLEHEKREYIVFCNSTGDVFYRELYAADDTELRSLSLYDSNEELDGIKAKFYAMKWDITCFMTQRGNMGIVAFGSKVFRLYFSSKTGKLTKKGFNIKRGRPEPELILDIYASKNYIFINEGFCISIIDINKGISEVYRVCLTNNKDPEKNTFSFYVNDRDFFFTYLSEIPPELNNNAEGVLVGIRAYKNDNYDNMPDFFMISVSGNNSADAPEVNVKIIRNEQKLATHSGVFFRLSDTDHTRLATTCDDRSIDIQVPDVEDIAINHISGAYNGVHDIRILDSNNAICALYDGNALHISYSTVKQLVNDPLFNDLSEEPEEDCDESAKPEGVWSVRNVRKIHKDWVWKICALDFDNWNSKCSNILTCSYDKTLMLTNLRSFDAPEVLIQGNEPILDFCISSDSGDLWAISQSAIYHCRNTGGKLVCDSTPVHAPDKHKLRAITENIGADEANDVPLVFYNQGSGSDGILGTVSEGEIKQLLNLGEDVFIRQMTNCSVDGKNYLIAAGGKEQKSFVVVIRIISSSDYQVISSASIPVGDSANSFAFINSKENMRLIVLNKNNTIAALKLNPDMTIAADIASVKTPAQPICIDVLDDLALVGLLNGQIMRLNFTSDTISVSDFINTHADLIANHDIDLSTCVFENDQTKRSFIDLLKDYFTI